MCCVYEIQIDYADAPLNPESTCFVQTNKAFTSPCPAEAHTGRLMITTEHWDVAQRHFRHFSKNISKKI